MNFEAEVSRSFGEVGQESLPILSMSSITLKILELKYFSLYPASGETAPLRTLNYSSEISF
jgi:hypothetical protein